MNRYEQNTWRILNGLEPFPTMEEVVQHLTQYINTYENQVGYKKYTEETLIDDILYGLGVSLSKEYEFLRTVLVKPLKNVGGTVIGYCPADQKWWIGGEINAWFSEIELQVVEK